MEMPLDFLMPVAKGTGLSELPGNVTVVKTVLGRPPQPGHCTDSRLKYSPSIPVKRAISLELPSVGQSLGFPHP